ncbi:MAG: PEF-CTERM sorting domain-containing protein [Clostridia bacterium]|nr:PEF-CTERM sorting domain-containing protein [Clostridia bacterium]
MSTASAYIWVHDMEGSSYPNPSIEGQEVTYTINVTLFDSETGEIYPANGGYCGWFQPVAGPIKPLVNGTASMTRSNVAPGNYNIEIIYFWTTSVIGDRYGSMNHKVLPYVQDWKITSDNGNPATYVATFDFAKTGDPTFVPHVYYTIEVSDSGRYYRTKVPESGIVTWATPELQPGTYKVYARYYVEYFGEGRHEEVIMTYHVNGDETEIPEFPSVALPVIAVLGLLAIIGRKKE